MKEFDIVIIGAGPGGYVAAIRAAQMGANVALVEKDAIGGTCLNRGCIPTKSLYYSAKAVKAAKTSADYGVNLDGFSFDMEKAISRKDDVIKKLVGGVEQLLKGNKVEVIRGEGTVESAGKVVVKTGEGAEELGAKSIIIATGSEPARIPAFNIDGKDVITTTEALQLTKVPESMLVIGGGVNGCEFATLFSTFGSSVTIVELVDSILFREDKQIVRVVEKGFKGSGVNVLTGVEVEGVEVKETGKCVKTRLKDGREFVTEKVLVTIGRSFNSAGLGLDKAGVEVDRGKIVVNDKMETSVKGIYAIGDVTGKWLLAHVASVQGIVAVNNALGKSKTMDYSCVPAGIFTEPEIASVGMNEKYAKDNDIDYSIGRFPYAASGKALGMGETEGFVQILADPGTDKVLGCSIVGAHATDLVGEVALAIKTGAKVEDITETIHAHPTLPELVMEAAEDLHGSAIHKMSRRRR